MPRLEHLLNFTLRDGYSLWYDVIFVDYINVLVRNPGEDMAVNISYLVYSRYYQDGYIPVNSDVGPTSSGRHVHRQRVVIQFLMSGRRPADVND